MGVMRSGRSGYSYLFDGLCWYVQMPRDEMMNLTRHCTVLHLPLHNVRVRALCHYSSVGQCEGVVIGM